MTNEDRLLALLNQARQQRGDAILQAPGELGPMLAGWAPDLQAEARAVALALSQNAGGQLAAAPNVDAEAARLANQVAAQVGIAPAAAAMAIGVVRRLYLPGTASGAAPVAASAGSGGDVPFYERGALKKTWVRVVLALAALGILFNLVTGKFQAPAQPTQAQPGFGGAPPAQQPGG